MKKSNGNKQWSMLALVVGLLMSGCAANRQAVYIDTAAFAQKIDTVYVTPVIDARTDKAAIFDDSDRAYLRKLAMEGLENRGYHAKLLEAWKTDKTISDTDLSDMDAAKLCSITPSEARILFVITINDVHDKYTVMTANYSINGTMTALDRVQEKEIWKDVATGTHGGGGLVDAAFALPMRKSRGQRILMNQVLSSFPKQKKE